VANTAKRAFLIWLSVILFANEVTLLSGIGTAIVISGVLLYNKAQDYDKRSRETQIINFEPKFYDKKMLEA
jgi:solute carrier family 35 protein E2